jgi:hypothetical protein
VALDIAADFEVEALKRCAQLHDLLELKKNIDSSHLRVQTNADILQSNTTRVETPTNTQANTITPTHEEVNIGSVITTPTGTITKNDLSRQFEWQRKCNWCIHAWYVVMPKWLSSFWSPSRMAQDSYYKMKLVTVRDKHKVQCAVTVAHDEKKQCDK